MPFSTPFCTAPSRSKAPVLHAVQARIASRSSRLFWPHETSFYLGRLLESQCLVFLLIRYWLGSTWTSVGFKERSRSTLTGHSRIFQSHLGGFTHNVLSLGKHIYCYDLSHQRSRFAAIQAGSSMGTPVSLCYPGEDWVASDHAGILFATTSTDSFGPRPNILSKLIMSSFQNQDLSFCFS